MIGDGITPIDRMMHGCCLADAFENKAAPEALIPSEPVAVATIAGAAVVRRLKGRPRHREMLRRH